ncbi:MAG: GNAT family N-acetyltransferase [Gorillibacterium sp.]|nr:GNAT family N-acetyltransferase [Gorillibacterium sp.]
MQFETKRLWIRNYRADDWEAVHAYASDPLVTRFMLWGPNTVEETKAFIANAILAAEQNPRTHYELAVILKENGQLIGGCSLVLNGTNGEIGYCLHPEFWRKGYASEAGAELIRYSLEERGGHRIYATCRPENTDSAKVMERIGMKKEGHLREHLYSKGRFHDSFLYSILIQNG